MAKTLFIETWGCQMNDYDSKRISELLHASHGLTLVDSADQADVLLMNTCSIREKAAEKVFSELGRWKPLKDKNPNLIIGVGGCVASQEGQVIRTRAPYVDLIFGPATYHRLPQLLSQAQQSQHLAIDISFPAIEKFDYLPMPGVAGPTGSLSIQEGCSKYCKYCIVPFTRGEEVDRPFDDVLNEVIHIVNLGVKEVTFLGQNVNAYRGKMPDGAQASLALLIKAVARLPGVEMIRFTTSHPNEFKEDLIEAYATTPRLADHLHLPVQSGSDTVLARMGRGHTVMEYKDKIKKLRQVRPNISITSDFIVGYPGETEEEFQATLDLVKVIKFDLSFSFMYSPRPGTAAATLEDDVPLTVKKDRLARLQAALTETAKLTSDAMLGTLQHVLVTKVSSRAVNELSARTSNNRVVTFEGPATLIGTMVPVRITRALTNSLGGELCQTLETALA